MCHFSLHHWLITRCSCLHHRLRTPGWERVLSSPSPAQLITRRSKAQVLGGGGVWIMNTPPFLLPSMCVF
jgi:hypothetical protein